MHNEVGCFAYIWVASRDVIVEGSDLRRCLFQEREAIFDLVPRLAVGTAGWRRAGHGPKPTEPVTSTFRSFRLRSMHRNTALRWVTGSKVKDQTETTLVDKYHAKTCAAMHCGALGLRCAELAEVKRGFAGQTV